MATSQRRARPLAVLAVAGLTGLAMAGCGSMTAAQSAAQTSASRPRTVRALCATPAAASKVVIAISEYGPGTVPLPNHRIPSTQNKASKTVKSNTASPLARIPRPFKLRTVTNAPRVHSLLSSLCELPKFPHGPINCPAMFPGSYWLTFSADGRTLPVVTVAESGCQTVTGLGATRTAADRDAFWALLHKLAGPTPKWPVHLPGAPVTPGGTNVPAN